jgi:hypothetical protein
MKSLATIAPKASKQRGRCLGTHLQVEVYRPAVGRQFEDDGHWTSASATGAAEKVAPQRGGRYRDTEVDVLVIEVVTLLDGHSPYPEQRHGVHAPPAKPVTQTQPVSANVADS